MEHERRELVERFGIKIRAEQPISAKEQLPETFREKLRLLAEAERDPRQSNNIK
jgi:hypothetical protein